jgi:hypothetical protein
MIETTMRRRGAPRPTETLRSVDHLQAEPAATAQTTKTEVETEIEKPHAVRVVIGARPWAAEVGIEMRRMRRRRIGMRSDAALLPSAAVEILMMTEATAVTEMTVETEMTAVTEEIVEIEVIAAIVMMMMKMKTSDTKMFVNLVTVLCAHHARVARMCDAPKMRRRDSCLDPTTAPMARLLLQRGALMVEVIMAESNLKRKTDHYIEEIHGPLPRSKELLRPH